MSATRKRLAHRRAVNQRLAQADRANRCDHCLIALNGIIHRWFGRPEEFCSTTCRDAFADVERQKAGR